MERKENYNHLPSKFLVHDLNVIENNSDYSLEEELLCKIIFIQRSFRKHLSKINKNKNTFYYKNNKNDSNNLYSNNSELAIDNIVAKKNSFKETNSCLEVRLFF